MSTIPFGVDADAAADDYLFGVVDAAAPMALSNNMMMLMTMLAMILMC